MKHYFLALTLLCLGYGIHAQVQQPQFIMPLWFEDALGNKDTIWVGGDPSASSQQINPQFGEVAINTPFDSVFEVRGVHGDDNDWEQSKIVIDYNDMTGFCYLPGRTQIMIHALHLPVKISWDTTILATNSPCHINTFLTPDFLTFVFPNWYEVRVTYCMMTRDHIYDDFEYSEFPSMPGFGPEDLFLRHEFEVQGSGVKNLSGLWLSGAWDAPYCYTLLDNSGPQDAPQSLKVVPNPVNEAVQIESGQSMRRLLLRDIQGITLAEVFCDAHQSTLSLRNYPPGLYVLSVEYADGSQQTRKLLKH